MDARDWFSSWIRLDTFSTVIKLFTRLYFLVKLLKVVVKVTNRTFCNYCNRSPGPKYIYFKYSLTCSTAPLKEGVYERVNRSIDLVSKVCWVICEKMSRLTGSWVNTKWGSYALPNMPWFKCHSWNGIWRLSQACRWTGHLTSLARSLSQSRSLFLSFSFSLQLCVALLFSLCLSLSLSLSSHLCVSLSLPFSLTLSPFFPSLS